MKWVRGLGIVFLIVLVVFTVHIYTRTADGIGNFRTDLEFAARTDVRADGTVDIYNVRDFMYASGTVLSKNWIATTTVRSDEIVRAWFFVEPFPLSPLFAHTFVSFEFTDGSALAFSIEARIEEGDHYSITRGMLNEYEIALQWGYERDFLARRVLFLDNDVHMYPLAIGSTSAKQLFVALAKETQRVYESPRFYHTLFENCTNLIASVVNSHAPQTLPFDFAWHLTGNADRYLVTHNFIQIPSENTFESYREQVNLQNFRTIIEQNATSSYSDFSAQLRMGFTQISEK
jgi:hypothetical protein